MLVLPGTLLFSLVFIVTKVVSIKKAKEALAASNVKVQARDVMATWKLLVAMAAAPAAYLWYVCLGLYWYSYNNCNGYLPAGIQKRWLILPQLVVYITLTYGALRFGEVAMDILKSLGPLWKMMNPFSNSELVKLQERRENLALVALRVRRRHRWHRLPRDGLTAAGVPFHDAVTAAVAEAAKPWWRV